ncbi:hypothetical protein HZH68_014979 [Vespula germanica]|uniref:Uncharacterized protein n=1 Tax=Vespula germanica TaxID=30212 RepID=A0A834MS32_VESGE|nr:hypothetical protein HZH68_014979 [Vespula germanica]
MSRKVTVEREEVKAKYGNSPSEFTEITRHRYSREIEFSPIIQISLALRNMKLERIIKLQFTKRIQKDIRLNQSSRKIILIILIILRKIEVIGIKEIVIDGQVPNKV